MTIFDRKSQYKQYQGSKKQGKKQAYLERETKRKMEAIRAERIAKAKEEVNLDELSKIHLED